MAGKRDYYEVLGIGRDADAQAIKKAYRKQAIKYHPDRNKDAGAEDRFKEVSEAYAVLSDPEKRQRYDQFGHAGIDQQYTTEDIFRNVDFGDIFRGFGGGEGGFGSIFDMFFGGGGRSHGPTRGRDMQVRHAVTLEEAFAGTETELEYWRLSGCRTCDASGAQPGSSVDTCSTCGGQGRVQRQQRTPFGVLNQVSACPTCRGEGRTVSDPCHTCRGSGHERRKHTVTVKVPAGIDDGQSLRLTGQGEVGGRGGPHGDLYVEVQLRPHDQFHRDGPDLLAELPISIPQAVLGTEVDFDTLDGGVRVKVPAGSETGKTLRLRGKGMPYLRGSGRGDLHIRIRVVVPDKLSDKARGLFEELAQELGEDVDGRKGRFFDFLRG